MLLVGSSTSLPPGMRPGQRRIPGTRIPPSQLVAFPAGQSTDSMLAKGSRDRIAQLKEQLSSLGLAKERSRQLTLSVTLKAL